MHIYANLIIITFAAWMNLLFSKWVTAAPLWLIWGFDRWFFIVYFQKDIHETYVHILEEKMACQELADSGQKIPILIEKCGESAYLNSDEPVLYSNVHFYRLIKSIKSFATSNFPQFVVFRSQTELGWITENLALNVNKEQVR